jgi:hypothetical protein
MDLDPEDKLVALAKVVEREEDAELEADTQQTVH